MTDEEFRRTVAQELARLGKAVDAQAELLRMLSEQQGELNAILRDLCEGLAADDDEDDDEDPYGLFDGGDQDATSDL